MSEHNSIVQAIQQINEQFDQNHYIKVLDYTLMDKQDEITELSKNMLDEFSQFQPPIHNYNIEYLKQQADEKNVLKTQTQLLEQKKQSFEDKKNEMKQWISRSKSLAKENKDYLDTIIKEQEQNISTINEDNKRVDQQLQEYQDKLSKAVDMLKKFTTSTITLQEKVIIDQNVNANTALKALENFKTQFDTRLSQIKSLQYQVNNLESTSKQMLYEIENDHTLDETLQTCEVEEMKETQTKKKNDIDKCYEDYQNMYYTNQNYNLSKYDLDINMMTKALNQKEKKMNKLHEDLTKLKEKENNLSRCNSDADENNEKLVNQINILKATQQNIIQRNDQYNKYTEQLDNLQDSIKNSKTELEKQLVKINQLQSRLKKSVGTFEKKMSYQSNKQLNEYYNSLLMLKNKNEECSEFYKVLQAKHETYNELSDQISYKLQLIEEHLQPAIKNQTKRRMLNKVLKDMNMPSIR